MKFFHWVIFLIISIILILLSKNGLLVDLILFITISLILFILYSMSKDTIFFFGGTLMLFASIAVSSFGYDPYSFITIFSFSVPVFLSILFIEFISGNAGILRISFQVFLSIVLSILFIFIFGTYSIQEKNIISLVILISILIVSLYFLLDTISKE